ncbi:MAG TPA: hypothetical protein VM098_00150 [Phycisphaerae bacterium]|nr:hypothetical protein [Phycisphaerae bacterium]
MIGVLAVVAVAAAAIFVMTSGKDVDDASAPLASASASASPSASTSPEPSITLYLAAATGPAANTLSTVSADGAVSEISGSLGKQVFQIAWSPDGRRLACIAGQWRHPRLWVTDVQTGETREVRIFTPAIVAFDSVVWLTPERLLVAGFTVTRKAQGEVAELLVYDAVAGAVSEPVRNAEGVALRGVAVSASADGAIVAFVAYTDVKKDRYGMPTATERLQLLDRESGVVTELGTGKAWFDVNSRRFDDPLISPDGDAVIFRSAGSDVGTSYTVVDAAGTTLMPARELLYPAGYAWDPTGQKVVFTGHSTNWRGGSNDPAVFYLFDTATGGSAKVIAKYNKMAVQELSWSPDGQTIAFSGYDEADYETGSIYQFSPDGGAAELLLHDALFPAFQPAGVPQTP